LISLHNLDKNIDAAKSRLKSLDFKNLNREKQYNLDTLEKLVSTRRTVLISISIGLDCRDHQSYISCLTVLVFYLKMLFVSTGQVFTALHSASPKAIALPFILMETLEVASWAATQIWLKIS
jgi:hypothetical protein